MHRKYHYNKFKVYKENNIHLINIFENDWNDSKEIVKSIIKSKLGLNNKIYARKCEIREINNDLYRKFVELNHIQGYSPASIRIGLFYNNTLVGISSFSKSRHDKNIQYENIRTCFLKNYNIIGGNDKLFKYFIRNYNPENIVSFCDLSYFNGNSYLNIGYKLKSITEPSYFYFKGNKTLSRVQCQKHKLEKKLDKFDENLSEYDNMLNNGYMRVWNTGNYKFIWTNNS